MSSKNNPILTLNKIKVGITIGDPSGIGPAITLKALNSLKGIADFTVIGDKGVLERVAGHGYRAVANLIDLGNVSRKNFKSGKIKAEYGRASIEYLDKARELLEQNKIDCLVTCPISKEAVAKAHFDYSGHTEYFLKNTGVKDVVMMLLNDRLRFSLVTRHIPLNKVSASLSAAKIYNNIIITYKGLKDLFGIVNPRIGVCSVNPHASEGGLIGGEEGRFIKPAIKKLRNSIKAQISDPLSSDIVIHRAYAGIYDCVIAMYHDQALIPLKLAQKNTGVNITLGLPFVRTSPLHGTAFDIASNPKLANPDSMIAAVKLAIQCSLNQKKA